MDAARVTDAREPTREYRGGTCAYSVVGNLLLCVHIAAPSGEDWESMVDMAAVLQREHDTVGIVAVAFGDDSYPSTQQRTHATMRLDGRRLRLAIVAHSRGARMAMKAISLFFRHVSAFALDDCVAALRFVGAEEIADSHRILDELAGGKVEAALRARADRSARA